MALDRQIEIGGLGAVVFGTGSEAKHTGMVTSVKSALQPGRDIGFNKVNPEIRRSEIQSTDPLTVAIDKNLATQELLAEEALESAPYLVITVDVGTTLIHGAESTRTELHRLNRIYQDREFQLLDPEAQASYLANLYETEKIKMLGMVCQGNFMIEWQVAFSLKSLDGKVNETHKAVIHVVFNAFDEALVESYFQPQEGAVEPRVMTIGPRLDWAELAGQGLSHQALLTMEIDKGQYQTGEIDVKNLVALVVECRIPQAMINIIEAYFLNALPEPSMLQ